MNAWKALMPKNTGRRSKLFRLEARSSVTPAAVASSVASRPVGAGSFAQTRSERPASPSHCRAVRVAKARSALTRSLSSMDGLLLQSFEDVRVREKAHLFYLTPDHLAGK